MEYQANLLWIPKDSPYNLNEVSTVHTVHGSVIFFILLTCTTFVSIYARAILQLRP
jgi:hypothetical protein